MTNIQIEIAVAVTGILITAAVIAYLIMHCRLLERKVKLQEELVNIYTPDILKGHAEELLTESPELKNVEIAKEGSGEEGTV